MKIDVFLNHLNQIDACTEAVEWVKASPHKTFKEAWSNCHRPDWMLWLLSELEYNNDKILRLFACWCVRNTPVGDGKVVWDLLTDERSKNAVIIAEKFASGEATEGELTTASEAAWSAASDAARSTASAARYAASAARSAVWSTARSAAWSAVWSVAWSVNDATRSAASAVQAEQLRIMIPYKIVEKLLTERTEQ